VKGALAGVVDHVYGINLARRADRWRRLAARLRRRGIVAERFLAIDGRRLAEDAVPASLLVREFDTTGAARHSSWLEGGRRRSLSAGEVGCALSHVALWDDLLVRGFASALVLEDDVDFARGFVARLGELVARLPRRWDLVYLGFVPSTAPARPWRPGLTRPIYHFGTFAYLISRRGARRLLADLPVDEPIDTFLAARFGRLEVRCAEPPLVRPQPTARADSNVLHSALVP
jgi:GR25 family glycosyltransferase involved in LPS biosynthesis